MLGTQYKLGRPATQNTSAYACHVFLKGYFFSHRPDVLLSTHDQYPELAQFLTIDPLTGDPIQVKHLEKMSLT